MIARRRFKVVLAGLLVSGLVSAGIAIASPKMLVQLVGTNANDLACVHPATPLLPGFSRRGGPSADFLACVLAIRAELNKKKPPPASPVGPGLSWYVGINGSVEFLVESGSPSLPLTRGVVALPMLQQWVGYFAVHGSGIGTLTQFLVGAGAGSGSTASASSSAVSADAAAAVGGQKPLTGGGVVQDLTGITEWTLTGLAPDGSIDQLIVCRGTGQSKMLSLDRTSVPTPTDLVFPSTLSGGQLQRIGLASAIGSSAAILVVDFPSGCVQQIDVSGLRRALGRNPL